MSHTVKITRAFKELPILKKAFEAFGWTIKENARIRSFDQNQKVFPFVAVNPKTGYYAYDLGLEIAPDGHIEILGDLYGGSVEETLGKNMTQLKQQYSLQIIEDEFLFQGGSVNSVKGKTGDLLVDVELY